MKVKNRERETKVIKQIEESAELKEALKGQINLLLKISEQITQAFRKGNKVILFGNGGSAADAQHIACELMGKFYMEREPLSAIALTTNTSSLTAIANDEGYEVVFSRQLRGLVRKGDIVIGISCSGNSPNVLRGVEEAKRLGAATIAFTGQGGKLKEIADYVLSVPSTDTPRIQETHITAGHIICFLVEEALFGNGRE
ncbi:MAG TPA: D-sedoheptulose 7-phosphate isomerase [Dehalococcoidia bacterium]|nr:D-sedoheptulose 7-phosphate isomerase [Dehalococcoidia bacterium]